MLRREQDWRRLLAATGVAGHEPALSLHRQLLSLDPRRGDLQPPRAAGLAGDERGEPADRPGPSAVAGPACPEGISTEGAHSKSWDSLSATPDIVVTVCASAAGETCPAYLGPVLRTHWGVDDPAHATGTDDEVDAAFEKAYRILRARIEAFLALPLDALARDKAALKAQLDRIARLTG